MLADVSALVSRYSDSCDRGVSVSRIREPYNVVARVIVVGKLSRNALNANIVKSVAVKDLPCYLIGCKTPSTANIAVLV